MEENCIGEAGTGTCPFCNRKVALNYRRGTLGGIPFAEIVYCCLSCHCVGTYHREPEKTEGEIKE